MTLEIVEVNHVNITLPRAVEEAAKHFYGVLLGMEEIPKPEETKGRGGAWYRLGGLQLHVSLEDSATDNPTSKRHVCYTVRNLARAEEHLREAGVEIIHDDRPLRGWSRFYVRDPGGNLIEIAQQQK